MNEYIIVYMNREGFENDITLLTKDDYYEAINNEEVYGLFRHSDYRVVEFKKLKHAKKWYRQYMNDLLDTSVSLKDIEIFELERKNNPRESNYFWIVEDRYGDRGVFIMEGTPNNIESEIYRKYGPNFDLKNHLGIVTKEEAEKLLEEYTK